MSMVPSVPRLQRGAQRAGDRPDDLVVGRGQVAVAAPDVGAGGLVERWRPAGPAPLVKFMTLPLVRPKYLVFGWSVNGTTVSVLVVYAFQAEVMYGVEVGRAEQPGAGGLAGREHAQHGAVGAGVDGVAPSRTGPGCR